MEDAAGFKDFTVATVFERFVASIETCVATWAAKPGGSGAPRPQARLLHRFPWRSEPYTLALHLLPAADPQGHREQVVQQQQHPQQHHQQLGRQSSAAAAWPLANSAALLDAPDRLQQWFGLRAFLLLTPDSYSGRVLEQEEVHTLLSAAAVALSHVRVTWPLLVPVHDAVRDGYRGVSVSACGATLHFDSDSLHSSRLRPGLLGLKQQLLLFARQLGAAGAPAAAAACRTAAGAELELPASMAADAAAGGSGRSCPAAGGGHHVALAVRYSYALAEPGEADEGGGGGAGPEDERRACEGGTGDWDERAPWRPWAAQADPIGCLELDVVWRFPSAAAALHTHALDQPPSSAAGEEASLGGLAPAQAASWRLLALGTSYERYTGHRGFVLRAVDKPRRFLRLQSLAGDAAQRILAGTADVAPELLPSDTSFSGMLLKLADSAKYAMLAPDLGCLASADWWLRHGTYQPPLAPDWVLQEATRDVLQMAVLPVWPAFPPGSVAWPTSIAGQHGCLGKAAPLGALVSRLALHAMALGSPRSVAELWSRVVSALRLQYWDALRPLPRMRLAEEQQPRVTDLEKQQRVQQADQAAGSDECASSSSTRPEPPNLELGLLHQKLQMLDLCIHLLRERRSQPGRMQRQEGLPAPAVQPNGSCTEASAGAAAQPATASDGWRWDGTDEVEAPADDGQERHMQSRRQRQQDGRQQQPSPSSSTSSYFSAAGGSEGSPLRTLSPACSSDQLQSPTNGGGAEPCSSTAAAAAPGVVPLPAGVAGGGGADGAVPGVAAAPAALLPREAPEGAVGELPGISLHLHPDRPLRVPAVQDPPPQTEDLLAEQQAALQAHPASPGQDASALRAQLQGRMLLSDMQAFKAANPGCCLLDFVRWHSPKDCIPAPGGSWKLSKRMAADGNAWQQLWTSAAALPATRQRPLLDPQLEGERVLHLLETLPPAALFAELLAVGYSAAVQLLSTAGPAAGLPAVQRQLCALEGAARAELLHGVAAEEAPAEASEQWGNGSGGAAQAAAAEPAAVAPRNEEAAADDAAEWEEDWEADEDEEQHTSEPNLKPLPQPAWLQSVYGSGLRSWRYRRLLLVLGCAEQAVVASHSLMLRLGSHALQQQHAGNSSGSEGTDEQFVAASTEKLIAAALGEHQPVFCEPQLAAAEPAVAPAAAVDLPTAHRQAAEALVVAQRAIVPTDGSGRNGKADGAAGKWPAPFQREWLLQVHSGHAPSNGSEDGHGDAGRGIGSLPVLQRMYFRALPSEVRVATVLSAETCRLP